MRLAQLSVQRVQPPVRLVQLRELLAAADRLPAAANSAEIEALYGKAKAGLDWLESVRPLLGNAPGPLPTTDRNGANKGLVALAKLQRAAKGVPVWLSRGSTALALKQRIRRAQSLRKQLWGLLAQVDEARDGTSHFEKTTRSGAVLAVRRTPRPAHAARWAPE